METCRGRWEAYRQAAQAGGHLRVPEMVAWLAVGFELFTDFMVHLGVLDDDATYDLLNAAWKAFMHLGRAHSRRLEEEKPTLKFLNILNELFVQKRVYVRDTGGRCPEQWFDLGWKDHDDPGTSDLIGWTDEDYLYLMPESTYRAVLRVIKEQGGYFSPSKNMLLKSLGQEGLIELSKEGETTKFKKIRGKSERVMFLPKVKIME